MALVCRRCQTAINFWMHWLFNLYNLFLPALKGYHTEVLLKEGEWRKSSGGWLGTRSFSGNAYMVTGTRILLSQWTSLHLSQKRTRRGEEGEEKKLKLLHLKRNMHMTGFKCQLVLKWNKVTHEKTGRVCLKFSSILIHEIKRLEHNNKTDAKHSWEYGMEKRLVRVSERNMDEISDVAYARKRWATQPPATS